MRTFACLTFLLCLAGQVGADPRIKNVGGKSCRGGPQQQPNGPFAVFVFCDDAVGTNIAVFYSKLGDPPFEKWTLTHRFWQSDAWGADVHSIGWVPNRNALVVTTSEIYGTGAVYLLSLETQTSVVLAEPKDCGSEIQAISEQAVTVGLNDCEHAAASESLVLPFPKQVSSRNRK
jgi:hypothetical protein